jgi:hypothetical protein
MDVIFAAKSGKPMAVMTNYLATGEKLDSSRYLTI